MAKYPDRLHVRLDNSKPKKIEVNPVPDPAEGKHSFSSGATSSEHIERYDLLSPYALKLWAKRRTEGAQKHGDINFQKCVTTSEDGRVKVLDLGFARDRFSHLVKHCYIMAAKGNEVDDNLGAAFCNLEFLAYIEEQGFDLGRVLTGQFTDETELAILSGTNELLWVRHKDGIFHYNS